MINAEVKKLRRCLEMAVISMKQLLEAGVHFGHQTKRWNPKMKKYISEGDHKSLINFNH